LDRLESILPAVKSLAIKHVDYGVRAEQYDDVGAALLWTLKQGLGSKFTAAHYLAWDRTYALLAQTMREAARDSVVTVK
jgi:nitric oxide dioxygenase